MRRALAVVVSCLAFLACGDSTAPSVATSLVASTALNQNGVAGKPVPETPSFVVRDQDGNAMAGVPVTVTVTGGGSIAGIATQSAGGSTPIGQWTLGQAVGSNTVKVNVAGLPTLTFTAQGLAGPLAVLSPVGSLSLVGRIGSTINPGPRVVATDEFDNPIGGLEIAVQASAGSSAGTSTIFTEANGTAQVPSWTLGPAGNYTLTLSAGGRVTQFTAVANSGPPTSVSVVTGGTQTVPAGAPLPAPLVIRVQDEFGSNVDFENVGFTVIAGGGSLAAATAATDGNGVVTAPQWTMGKSDVPQILRVTAGSVSVDVLAQIATQFNITLRFPGAGMSSAREAAFMRAAQRLQGVIVNDLPDIPNASLDMDCFGAFPGEVFNGPIDDVVIYAAVVAIDGPGNVLGRAGPCWIRSSNPIFPLIGVMQFDQADVASLEAAGRLEDVILHEMLHVIGIGTLWASRGLIEAPNSLDVRYLGEAGRMGCVEVGGLGTCATSVPVQSCSPPADGQTALQCAGGSVNSHWRETTFVNELMTSSLNAGGNPLSGMTIGAIGDLGYVVNGAARDVYVIQGGSFRANLLPGSGVETPWESIIRPVGTVDPSGKGTLLPGVQ